MADLKWKATPRAKIFEAWSALADGRVAVDGEGRASVWSSDRVKAYTVVWTDDRKSFGANDNASYWVGYAGYPIIAVVLHLGLVPSDSAIVTAFRDVNWKSLNELYKRRYDDVVDFVISKIEDEHRGSSVDIRKHAHDTFEAFKALRLGRIIPPGTPPKR
jgi:hypothetical protein